MKRKRFNEGQIISIFKEHEAGGQDGGFDEQAPGFSFRVSRLKPARCTMKLVNYILAVSVATYLSGLVAAAEPVVLTKLFPTVSSSKVGNSLVTVEELGNPEVNYGEKCTSENRPPISAVHGIPDDFGKNIAVMTVYMEKYDLSGTKWRRTVKWKNNNDHGTYKRNGKYGKKDAVNNIHFSFVNAGEYRSTVTLKRNGCETVIKLDIKISKEEL